MPNSPRVRHVGRDRVDVDGDRLTVITPSLHMPGWEVRKYRAPVIRFDGRTWRISSRTVGPDKLTRYSLERWEPGDGEITGAEIDYSAEYAALRDHTFDLGRRRSRGTMLLNCVSPLTGFLPARTKAHLEVAYGIDPVTSTKWSIFIQYLVALGSLVVASTSMVFAFVRASPLVPFWAIAVGLVAAVDASIRWGRVLSEERPPPGFYEWLFKRRRG